MEQNREIAIQLSGVKKMYKLGQIGGATLQADLQSWWARKRGKEDPNTVIGQEQRLVGQTFMALNGIDLTVYKGEALGIIGGNGAGKSTMLKLLSQVTAPTSGTIDLYGRVASMLEVGTGFNGEMTGRENVYMNGAILGMTKAEIDAKMEQIIDFSEVRDFIDTPVKRYSSGMYVKLAFSVAAHLDSEIMIMDEVLAVGDMAFQKKCLTKMREAAKENGRTVLYVSHNMNTIRQLCDRVVVLNKGKVAFDGDVEKGIEIYSGCVSELRTSFDYTNYKRSPNESRKLQMLGLDISGKDRPIIQQGNDLEFFLHCYANQDYHDIGLRFEIYTSGIVAGTAFLSNRLSGKAGDTVDLHIKLHTKNFVPARYSVVALLYEDGCNGQQAGIDRVEPALIFEIVEINKNSLVWLPQYWGYTKYDDMNLIVDTE